MEAKPFDAVLLVAFGGPQGPADVRPFLENVLRGRRVSPERIEEVAHHYELFGGVSPITELTVRQARALERELQDRGLTLPVYLGMRNWHPFLADTLDRMAAEGHHRAIGILAAAQRSYSGCLQYRENVRDARLAVVERGRPPIEVTYVGDWHEHPGFIEANADSVREAVARLPEQAKSRARLIFTAHSIPTSMAAAYPYERNLRASAAKVAHATGFEDWELVFQSRSGRPQDPWLEPDVCDALRAEHARGTAAVVLCPVGFLCDHVEVLYDLDVEAAAVAKDLHLPLVRASTVNAHPRFIDALADAVSDVWDRYKGGRPLPLAAG
jgi:protoporphyrin/coproporphyrin ferrochelatase